MVHFENRPLLEQFLIIAAAALFFNSILIATPGFYSHDELAWIAFIKQYNSWGFGLSDPFHAQFFRPLGAAIISLALRFPLQPIGSHFVLALFQAASCCALYCLVRKFRSPREALTAALLFALMPGAEFCVGWIAAAFDVLFTFGALIALGTGVTFWRGGGRQWAIASGIAYAAALLCKETAVVVPAATLALAMLDKPREGMRRRSIVFAVHSGLVLLYVVLRAPALLQLGEHGSGGYQFTGLAGIARNSLAYFVYPFAYGWAEISDILQRGDLTIFIGVSFNVVLIFALFLKFKWRGPIFYILAFYLPLAPVLLISKYETQYIYASSIALSVAISMLFGSRLRYSFLACGLAGMLVWHGLKIQQTAYATGVCQTKALAQIRADVRFLPTHQGAAVVYAGSDTPWWVLARALFAHTVSARFSPHRRGADLQFMSDCSVAPISPTR